MNIQLNPTQIPVLRATVLALAIVAAPAAIFAETNATIQYSLDPPASDIGPDVDVAELIVEVRSATGVLLPARLQIELDAPPENLLVSTDFPIVEGTRLIRADVNAVHGEHRLRYLFPIRGEYRLKITAGPLDTSSGSQQWQPKTKTFEFTLSENPGEVLNLLLLMAGLFVFGGVAGTILGRSTRAAGPES